METALRMDREIVATKRVRKGQMIPIVGFILLVFAFVAFGYMAQSQSTTSITGIAIYGMQAHQLGLAVADEVALGLETVYDEEGGAPWKMELVNALDGAADGADITLEPDVGSLLADSPGLVDDVANSELVDVKLRLHGFHRLHYHGNDLFDAPEAFYGNEHLDADIDAVKTPPRDWVGYATVQVKVKVRGIERQVQITRDLKLVDVQPPGREFAYFNWMGLMTSQEALAQYSLNRGGDMAIWPQQAGRVMIRGPYVVLAEGEEECTGGKKRSGSLKRNYTWPFGDDKWYGWSVLPPRRAAPWNPIASPWGGMIRPDDLGNDFEVKSRLPTKEAVSVVPPFSIGDAITSEYLCGVTPVGTQTFSLIGRPGRNVPGVAEADTLSMFRGLRVDLEAGQPTGPYDGSNSPGGGGNGDGIMPEGGGLISLVNHARFENNFAIYTCFGVTTSIPPIPCFHPFSTLIPPGAPPFCPPSACLGGHNWATAANPALDPQTFEGGASGSYVASPWAIQYAEEESQDFFDALIGFALSYAMSYAFSATSDVGASGTFFDSVADAASSTAWGSVLDNVGLMMTEGLLKSQLTAMSLDPAGSLSPRAAEIAANMPEGLFPPKFRRHYMRGATRLHLDLADALSLDQTKLNLEGIVMVERFPDTQVDFDYTGKGILFTQTDGEINKSPFLGDIKPATPGEDWMTFAHVVQRDPQPDGGDCQVRLNSNVLEMTLYAEEGITTETESTLNGNYLTMTPNKHKIPQGATFDVFYKADRLAPQSVPNGANDDQWTNGSWKRVTVSPKVSGYFDRFQ
jgi:hypothetical protein